MTAAMLYRRVVDWQPDPRDNQRRIYTLDCGHRVSRRTYGNKRRALCEICGEAVIRAGQKAG